MYGLYNFVFGGRGNSSGRGVHDGEDDCFNRWEKEDKRCEKFYPLNEKRWYFACKDRAADRRNLCIRNGGKPDPNEADEFGWHDIPRDMPRR
jgi:hypothetical protein